MNYGRGRQKGEKAGRQAGRRQRDQHGPVVNGIEDGRDIGPHREKSRMAHMEHAGVAQNDVQRQGQKSVKPDLVQHPQPIGARPEQRRAEKERR
jgi:hypothetical protein